MGNNFKSHAILYLKCRRLLSDLKISKTERSCEDYHRSFEQFILKYKGMIPTKYIRNFGIVAHIDHGKSTLADRILKTVGALNETNSKTQQIDNLSVEIQRGITVKAKTISAMYTTNNTHYLLNLIDTPGHVDFSYEVSRSIVAACDGAILLVDATRGIEAQTVSNFELVLNQNKMIVPVVNKIDMKNANVQRTIQQLCDRFGFVEKEILCASAKKSTGIIDIIDAVVNIIPCPNNDHRNEPFFGRLYDMWYDNRKGVVCVLAIEKGSIQVGSSVKSKCTEASYVVKELGILSVSPIKVDLLYSGQVGYVILGMKQPKEAVIGDIFYNVECGLKYELDLMLTPPKPTIYAGIFPTMPQHYDDLRNAVNKLMLNDSSVEVVSQKNDALGNGWRAGFLGSLHMEIFQQRLEQEFQQNLIITTPSVSYRAKLKSGAMLEICSPDDFPDIGLVEEFYEPYANAIVVCPSFSFEPIEEHFRKCRGQVMEIEEIGDSCLCVKISVPLAEIIVDTFGTIKRVSSGYASFKYDEADFKPVLLQKIDVTLNGKIIPPLSRIVLKQDSKTLADTYCKSLKDIIPRHQFEIDVRAVIGNKTISRSLIKPFRKDVTQHLYGGDISRRKKLLDQQKEGKKRLKLFGNIEVPQEAFVIATKKLY